MSEMEAVMAAEAAGNDSAWELTDLGDWMDVTDLFEIME